MQRWFDVAVLASLVVLAGCLGGPVPAESPDSTESPTASPIADGQIEWPDGPKETPDRPAELTRDSVADYVRTYEYRYVYNSLWYSQYSNVSVTCEVESVEEIDAGWRAVVSCTGYSNTGGEANGNETATVMHADWFTQTFVYYVDEDSVVRQRAED